MTDICILEEFLDTITFLPVDIKRYLILMRELDVACMKDQERLHVLQENHLNKLSQKKAKLLQEKEKLNEDEQQKDAVALEEDLESLNQIQEIRESLMQKLDEKKSIADQLHDMIGEHVTRLNHDVTLLESVLKVSGSLEPGMLSTGRLVAACTSPGDSSGNEALWILARVVSYLPSMPDRCTVADVENESNTHNLATKNVVVLPDEESLANARERLGVKGKTIMAIYPNTTSFYECTIITPPYRSQGPDGKERTVVDVEFHDDEDAITGVPPIRVIPSTCVFIRAGYGKRRRERI